MTRARILQEVRQMRFEELYARRQQRIFTMAEAGAMLGVTERTFRRWSGRYDAEGTEERHDGGSAEPRLGPCRWMTWWRCWPCIKPAIPAGP
ncbi:MAG: hypothetical protein AAB433_01730 [Nitrospirota bacterium]